MTTCPHCGQHLKAPSRFDGVSFKQWKMEEAQRLGTNLHALEMKLYRGHHPMPPTVKINSRVVRVLTEASEAERQKDGRQKYL